jgi:YbbR domain-containing protein
VKISDKDFTATVDYSTVDGAGLVTLPVVIDNRATNVQITKVSQQSIKVALDTVEDRAFKIAVRLEGTPLSGYQVIRAFPVSDTIMINGLTSLLDSIKEIIVITNVEGISRDATVEKTLTVYDQSGLEITSLKGKYTAQVKLETAKQVDVLPVVVGTLPAGFFNYTTSVNPVKIWITGPGDLLDSITGLETEAISVAAITGNTTVPSKLILPDGVSLYNSPASADITITVLAFVTSTITIPSNQIDIVNTQSATYTAEILTTEISIELSGLKTDLDLVTVAKLSPAINVSTLTEGTYNVPLSLRLPSNVELKGNYFVSVKITKK